MDLSRLTQVPASLENQLYHDQDWHRRYVQRTIQEMSTPLHALLKRPLYYLRAFVSCASLYRLWAVAEWRNFLGPQTRLVMLKAAPSVRVPEK